MPTIGYSNLGFPFHFSFFLIEFVKMACVVRLSALEAVQRKAWMTASSSAVKLEAETVKAALFSWMVVSPCLSVKPHSDWAVSEHWDLVVCCLLQ